MNHKSSCSCSVCIGRRVSWQRRLNALAKRERLPKPQPDQRNWSDEYMKSLKR